MGKKIARSLIQLLMRLLTRVEIIGLENLPPTGGYIAASNHLGRLDPALVYAFLDREDVVMLVAEKYQENPVFRWLATQLDAVFINRFNADFSALRAALKRLKAGEVLVVAPEGTRSQSEALIEGHPGVSFLAARSGAPVVPVGIIGTEDRGVVASLRRLRRPCITVRVGEPFRLPPLPVGAREEALQEYTDEIMVRIAALLPAEYRGVYANHPRLKELG